MGQTFMSNVFNDFAAQRDIYVVSAVKSTVKDVFSGNSTGSHSVVIEHDGRRERFYVFLAPGVTADAGTVLEFLISDTVDGLFYFSEYGQAKDDDASRQQKIRKYVKQMERRLIRLLGPQLVGELLEMYYRLEDIEPPVPVDKSYSYASTDISIAT